MDTDKLTPRERQIYEMRWLQNMSLCEIATRLGIARTTVRIHITHIANKGVIPLQRQQQSYRSTRAALLQFIGHCLDQGDSREELCSKLAAYSGQWPDGRDVPGIKESEKKP